MLRQERSGRLGGLGRAEVVPFGAGTLEVAGKFNGKDLIGKHFAPEGNRGKVQRSIDNERKGDFFKCFADEAQSPERRDRTHVKDEFEKFTGQVENGSVHENVLDALAGRDRVRNTVKNFKFARADGGNGAGDRDADAVRGARGRVGVGVRHDERESKRAEASAKGSASGQSAKKRNTAALGRVWAAEAGGRKEAGLTASDAYFCESGGIRKRLFPAATSLDAHLCETGGIRKRLFPAGLSHL